MQLNLVQFLGALTAGFTQGLSAEAGIVTLESGDTFDVKANIQGLQSLLMCASLDLKDADTQLTQFVSNDDQDEPYYNETRKQLLAVREGLESITTSSAILAQEQVDMTDMKVSTDGGLTYRLAPHGVRIIYEKVAVPGEDELGQVHINATSEGIITDVWVTRKEHLDHNIGTSHDTAEGIASDLVEENL